MRIIEFPEGSWLGAGDCVDLLHMVEDTSLDLVVTSPPYCMGKPYEKSREIKCFVEAHTTILPLIVSKIRPGGSVCWQIGNHVSNGVLSPLDFHVHQIMSSIGGLTLRNRIVWTFGHGTHAQKRLSPRYETILWYTKGDEYTFNLDSIRVPQRYPGKKFYKGPNKGKYSSNPLGKNPSDVWDIPHVKASHPEKTEHPCQFPIELAKRLILGMSPVGGVVLDPFCGSGSTGAAAVMCGRRFVGAEIDKRYVEIAASRIQLALNGELRYRKEFTPIMTPIPTHSVSRRIDAVHLSEAVHVNS